MALDRLHSQESLRQQRRRWSLLLVLSQLGFASMNTLLRVDRRMDNDESLQYRPRLTAKVTETLKAIQPLKGTQLSSIQGPSANSLEHYEDILSIIIEKAWRDKQKEVQTRLNFGENSKKSQRERENSNSRAENSPARFHSERSRTRGRERRDDINVFSRLSHRRKTVHERLNDTYSPSTTKSGPSRTDSRDPFHSRGHSLSRERPRMEDHPGH
ncbi:hypothetical protein Tco_1574890 [Tanacetum coccineum]